MFFKFSKDKNSLGYNINSRFLVTYPIVFLMAFSLLAYILYSTTDEMKYNLRVFNYEIQSSIKHAFDEVHRELDFQARIINWQNDTSNLAIEPGREFDKFFNAMYVIDNKGNIVADHKGADAFEMANFDIPWSHSVNRKDDYAVSNFIYKNNKPRAIYAIKYLSEDFNIVGEVSLQYLQDLINQVVNSNRQVAYIIDHNGNFVAGMSGTGAYEQAELSDATQVDQYFVDDGVIDLSYLKLQAKLVEYIDELGLFIVTYTPEQKEILYQIVLVITGIFLLALYTFLTLNNILFIKSDVKGPIIELTKYAADLKYNPKLGFIKEYQVVYAKMAELNSGIISANDEVAYTKARFSYIFEHSPLIILVYDAYDGTIIDASNAAAEFYGYSLLEFKRLTISDISTFKFDEKIYEYRQALDDKEQALSIKHRLKNGKEKEVLSNANLITLKDKRLIFDIITDVTEIVNLRDNNEKIMNYYSKFQDVMLVSGPQDPFRIIHATQNVKRLFGIELDDVLQNGFDLKEYLHLSDRTNFINEIEINKRIFSTSINAKEQVLLKTHLITSQNSSVLFEISAHFLRDQDGEFSGVAYMLSNYAEHQARNEKYEAELANQKNLVWASNSIPFEFDAKNQIIKFGEELSKILGYNDQNELVVGADQMRNLMVDGFDGFEEFFSSIQTQEGVYEDDVRFLKRDGGMVWIHIKGKGLDYDDKKPLKISGVVRNISVKKLAMIYQSLASKLFTYSSDHVIIFDLEWKIIDVNNKIARDVGYNVDELLGRHISVFFSKLSNIKKYEDAMEQTEQFGQWHGKLWSRRKNGEDYVVDVNFTMLTDDRGRPLCYVILATETGHIKTTQDYLTHVAYHDPLTKLPNRFLFHQKLEDAIFRPKDGKKVAVAYIDMDGFKAINERYGHKAGDAWLVEIANKIDVLFEERDMFARIGGDEFVAIIMHENRGEIYEVVENMLRIACSEVEFEGNMLKISASIGVSIQSIENQVDSDTMLDQADWAMYQAKLSGKNRYYIFDITKDKNLKNQYDDNGKIMSALANQEFFLEYQPEIDIRTGDIVSYEALIRWRRDGEIIYPNDFLPLVKKHSVIDDIAFFAIENALKAQSEWSKRQNFANVCVNLSIEQLCTERFFLRFKEFLIQYPELEPKSLIIEIIDANSIQSLEFASKFLQKYKRFGVSFVLDDFASKTSSFEALELLPIDQIKVDKNICTYMFFNQKAFLAVRMIKDVSDIFEKSATIKNLKDISTLKMLIGLGFCNFQGNFFAKPMTLEKLLEFKFDGIEGIDLDYHISDDEFENLKECIALKEFAQNIISILGNKEYTLDNDSFEGLKNDILHRLNRLGDTRHKAIADKINLALLAHSRAESLALARAANIMCVEILNLDGKENLVEK